MLPEKTLALHQADVFDKLDLSTRAAATAIASRKGLA
jgi:DNA-binding NarL/FixJ family response regulator